MFVTFMSQICTTVNEKLFVLTLYAILHEISLQYVYTMYIVRVLDFVNNLHTKPILPQEGRLALISFPMCCLLSFTNFTAAALYPVANRDMLLYSEINRVHIYHTDVD